MQETLQRIPVENQGFPAWRKGVITLETGLFPQGFSWCSLCLGGDILIVVRRTTAVAMMLFSPALMTLALSLCCLYAMPCTVELPSCHEEEGTKLIAPCCVNLELAPAGASTPSAQFTLSLPANAFELGIATEQQSGIAAASITVPVFASPPTVPLRI